MTNTKNSTYPKTKTEQIQEYLERDLPKSVLIAAYRTGRHESIVKYVKEQYGQSTISYKAPADFIGIEIVVRDAINRIGIKTSPYKELAALPTISELTERYGEAAAIAISDERNQWLRLIEGHGLATGQETPHQFVGHADAPTTWCVVPDSRTANGYCGQPRDAAIHANGELAEELRKAIFDVELMIELNQVTDGPRNSKERVEQAERHALVGRLTKIRRALYRSKDVIENLEA